MTTEIIDSIQHLPPAQGTQGDPFDSTSLNSALAEQQVTQAVLLEERTSEPDGQRALMAGQETDYIGAVVTWVDLATAEVGETLDTFVAANPKFRGVCHPVYKEKENRWLLREEVLRGLAEVANRGLSLDLLVEPRNLPSVAELARALPELRMVIDHLGSPLIAQGIREPWGVYMLNIAQFQNVWCKVSGLVTRDVHPWRVSHIRGYVEATVRLFGYQRMMFGSDWPVHLGVADYGQVLETALACAGPFTYEQRERFLNGSARDFYRLG